MSHLHHRPQNGLKKAPFQVPVISYMVPPTKKAPLAGRFLRFYVSVNELDCFPQIHDTSIARFSKKKWDKSGTKTG
ncbi:hypothetical protein Acin_1243 [Acidaminococcus intestini RyC-MR95]|uniref:Uncharacterized protein n=1 Tax=Acidaminococcus intestini (strain RyC-MR95) TaxID=568816 RepID=G4Q8N5_ACIIR|nr:hypothetical protein Acin_1243 [Acidaminococcus intestini RyC-MR95]